MRLAALVAVAAVSSLALVACEDQGKINEQTASDELARLAPVVKEDAAQVRKGLPEGAKKLAALLGPDPGADLAALQRAIATARAQVQDLSVAKSTFFSFTDPSGTVLRSEADPDLLAGKNVVAAFPALKAALDPKSGDVEAHGQMQEMRGVRNGADTAWVVAHPVVVEGQLKGLFVTGWSYRRFAYHLEEVAKRDLAEAAQKAEKKQPPIAYVFVVDGDKAYGAPVTPDVDAQAIEALHLVEKTAKGPYKGALEVTGRPFGVAAERAPELGDKAVIAVMASAI
ncbi:MAG TPA: hypothetical protein VHB21_21325 [Minicystis sp.]|nr:hypothetical protein [Minicystis sp.]